MQRFLAWNCSGLYCITDRLYRVDLKTELKDSRTQGLKGLREIGFIEFLEFIEFIGSMYRNLVEGFIPKAISNTRNPKNTMNKATNFVGFEEDTGGDRRVKGGYKGWKGG